MLSTERLLKMVATALRSGVTVESVAQRIESALLGGHYEYAISALAADIEDEGPDSLADVPDRGNVSQIVADYRELLKQQCEAPDWPYPGNVYIATESAEDERWDFWQRTRQWADEADVAEAQRVIAADQEHNNE